jgi:hypothetical protein
MHIRKQMFNIFGVGLLVWAVSFPIALHARFPDRAEAPDAPRLRTRCVGFNRDVEAVQRFRGGSSAWEGFTYILAEFTPDADTLTTGNGTFGNLPFFAPDPDSARAAEGFVIRDMSINSRSKSYYARHLLWMAQYFESVSNGLFTIAEPDTLTDITPIIRLPEEMGYYGNNDQFGQRQTEFVRDAIVAADTLSDLDFSNYDAVMVFHAGAGEESDFGPPPAFAGDTPGDLFSSYIPFEILRFYVGENDPEYLGVRTTGPGGSEYFVQNAMIVPETLIQDSLYNPSAVYLDILGIMAHEYGHELGLPDLNDTDTSTRPAVGNFGLMASGLFNSSGRLPAHPIAWCKMFLGWEAVRSVSRDTTGVVLKGIEQPGEGTKLVRVPISSSEYFLLENRLRDSDFDGEFRFDDADGDNWPDLHDDDYQLDDGTFAEFDFGLPGILHSSDDPLLGSGVLIWHIDEEVIRKNFNEELTENCVNCNIFRQGIDLEEADGRQHLDEILPQTIDPGFGSPFDSYGGRVEGIKDDPNTEFSGDTSPSTASYTAGATDIAVTGFRSLTRGNPGDVLVDSLVAIDVSFDRSVPGWPIMVREGDGFEFDLDPAVFDGNGVRAADIDGDGEGEIAIATRSGDLFVWSGDGTNFIGNDREIRPFYSLGQTVPGTPALGDLTGDGGREVVIIDESGLLYVFRWTLQSPTGGGELLDGFPVSVGDPVTASPLLLDLDMPPDGIVDRIVVGTDPGGNGDGKVVSIRPDGSIDWEISVDGAVRGAPAAGDLDRNDEIDIVAGTVSGRIYRIRSDGTVRWMTSLAGESFVHSPGLADVDRDADADRDGTAERLGDLEIVLGSLTGRIFVLTTTGQIFGGEAVETGGEIRVPLALGDLDADGFVEIVSLVDVERKISVYRSSQSRSSLVGVENFPKYVSTSGNADFFSAPLLADLDGDGGEEIVFGTANNLVYAYDRNPDIIPLAQFPLGGKGLSTPFIGASEGDILAIRAADDRGMVYGWQLDVRASDVTVSWAQEGRDAMHTSANGDSLGETSVGSPRAFSEETFVIYPNPAPGRDETRKVKITYSLDEAVSDLNVDIYTVSGRHYASIEPSSASFFLPDFRHVLTWDISDVPSGVYLIRLSIERSNGNRSQLIKKSAIVK